MFDISVRPELGEPLVALALVARSIVHRVENNDRSLL